MAPLSSLVVPAVALLCSSSSSSAFVPLAIHQHQQHHRAISSSSSALSSTAESEVEALLRKARELKAAAAAAEEDLHTSLLDKKGKKDADTDRMIDCLFPADDGAKAADLDGLVGRVRSKRPSTDMLLRVVQRLHERETTALGLAHVEQDGSSAFKVVKGDVDDKELDRINGLIDRLVEATAVLDSEYSADEDRTHHHSEALHWTAGDVSHILGDKAKDLRREHGDGFKKRQDEYYEAAKRKEGSKFKVFEEDNPFMDE